MAPDSPGGLASALARVTSDEGLAVRLIEGGRAVAERHRWDRVVARLIEEYGLARELARPVPRPKVSPLSALYRRASTRAALKRAPRAEPAEAPLEADRIVVVRPGRLGDLLLADPLMAALGERYPAARIELVTDAADLVPPWMLDARLTQRPLVLRRGPDAWRRAADPERRASLAVLGRDWATAPPALLVFAVDLADPVMRHLATKLAATAPHAWRAGLASGGRQLPELHATIDPGPENSHEIERLLRLGAAAGAMATFRLPRVPVAPSPLPPWDGPTLVVHPGASRHTKRWPLGRWGQLAARLSGRRRPHRRGGRRG